MFIHLYLPLEKEKNVLVNIMMMNTNYDNQYKTEAFIMLKKSYFLLYGEKIRDMKENYFPIYV